MLVPSLTIICVLLDFVSTSQAFPHPFLPHRQSAKLKVPKGRNLNAGGKIIGGEDATPGQFPFQVSIQITPIFGDTYHSCGGVILNPTHIATAAHCVEGRVLNQVSVLAGAHNMKVNEPTQQRRYPKRLIWHDFFDSELLNHDCAVITVTEPFQINEWVQPLRLAEAGYDATGSNCTNSGWGNANPSGGTPVIIPDALQFVTLEAIPQENCTAAYIGESPVDETMVCARGLTDDSYTGSCNGDSGGPLICMDPNEQPFLMGLVSWGLNPCGQYRYPTVFANVANEDVRTFLITEADRP